MRRMVAAKGYEVLRLTISSGRVLCVTIDADPGPVTIHDATWMNHRIREALAAAGLPVDDYQVEVESPGVRRPLRTLRHFERFIGARARVKLRVPGPDGNRVVIGIIEGVHPDRGSVEIGFTKAAPLVIPLENVAEASLDPEYKT